MLGIAFSGMKWANLGDGSRTQGIQLDVMHRITENDKGTAYSYAAVGGGFLDMRFPSTAYNAVYATIQGGANFAGFFAVVGFGLGRFRLDERTIGKGNRVLPIQLTGRLGYVVNLGRRNSCCLGW
jgi:hypothetical protein